MKLNKALKLSIGALIAFPLSFILGTEIRANYLTDRFDYELSNDNLLACGGGGGGGGASPAAKAAAKKKKAKAKLMFKQRKLSQAAAAGEDTSKLAAEIAELEAALAE